MTTPSTSELLVTHSGTSPIPHPVCGNISSVADPTPTDLAEARLIDLTRAVGSPEATSLVEAVAAAIAPHLDRKRALGAAGQATFRVVVGAILGGLLRPHFKDRVVAAQSRPGGSLWKHSPIGHRAFWGKVRAMQKAGLVELRSGIKTWSPFSAAGFDGQATRLWPKLQLVVLAAAHGVTASTVGRDWPISRAAETMRPVIAHCDLVVCRDLLNETQARPIAP